MHRFTMRTLSFAFALAGSVGLALGQDKVPQVKADDLKMQDTVPPATGKNSVPEQAGAQEPSSRAPSAKNADVLTDGALTAPGSPVDIDTVPAKYSVRTAADDQLPIAAYRLKHLTNDQRHEIVKGLGQKRDALSGSGESSSYMMVGAEVPSAVAQHALTPMPEALTAKFPELRGTAFARAAGKTLVVDLDNSLVIGVLEG